MTPEEISEYKNRWLTSGGYPVKINSELHIEGKDWCRRYLERQQWSFEKDTGDDEHTFWFEELRTSQQFAQEFYDWIIR